MVFKRIPLRIRDMKTIGRLMPGADKEANMAGEEKPGAEHFVLSALNLEDGTAKRIFERFGIDSGKFREAIKAQYSEALSSVGLSQEATEIEPEPIDSDKMFHDSQPSGQNLLLGAHIIIVAAAIEHGVVPRVFKVLGIDRGLLVKAAREELDSFQC